LTDKHDGDAAWVSELGVPIIREREVTGFARDDAGVDVELSDGQWLRAGYLVGCHGEPQRDPEGGGIEFPNRNGASAMPRTAPEPWES
jgi:3-(3-hydroxy-phenyl)propionate hydroxylase